MLFGVIQYFSKRNIEVLTRNYKNNTNVKLDSDVDISVCNFDTFYYDLPENTPHKPEYFGIYPSTETFVDFKNKVETALVNKFGRKSVVRGNKAFDIHENSYRVDADANSPLL